MAKIQMEETSRNETKHTPHMPICWNPLSKPSKFCSGCGHQIALKYLGFVIDDLDVQDRVVFGVDIGCSLLAWDFFNVDTIQTHHGRTTPTLVGLKRSRPELICIAYMGDGGAYAIGAQHLVNSAMRNDNLLVIVGNNTNYGMTGGQLAPTTLIGQKTETTPFGRTIVEHGRPMDGCKLVASLAQENTFVARVSSARPLQMKKVFKGAIQRQLDGRGFAFVEVLVNCPTNWRTDAETTLVHMREELVKTFPTGIFVDRPNQPDKFYWLKEQGNGETEKEGVIVGE